jgi:7-carboxy-7-deazaguanine synthase (Cx14CxxC type)
MPYLVKEIYYTLQGEGMHAGRPAVFCRFSGCNLWNGKEESRATAFCQFCDTDFAGTDGPGGGSYSTAEELAHVIDALWPSNAGSERPYVVCTGGEPLLQLDSSLIYTMHAAGMIVAVETNGTLPAPEGIDWLCVSPKANAKLRLRSGHELKLVYPQDGADPSRFVSLNFKHFLLQPMDGPSREVHTRLAAKYCLNHPQWRLSLQTHKLLGLP